MNVRVAIARELGPAEWSRWSDVQRAHDGLGSPFFRPEFTRAIAETDPEVRIGVVESSEGVVGFFPFHAFEDGRGGPIGGPLSDYQGIIGAPGAVNSASELVARCGLRVWAFDHVPAGQPAFEPYAHAQSESPQIDLSHGFEAYVRARPQAGRRPFARLADHERELTRTLGPIRFEFSSRDPRHLETLLQLKSDQYSRTNARPLFDRPEMRAALGRLWSDSSADFSTVLSTLHAGDTLVAAHLGLRTPTVLHWWFPAYEPRVARYSPGLLLLRALTAHAPKAGIVMIDLGKGAERYKHRFANQVVQVFEGHVQAGPGVADGPRAHAPSVTMSPVDGGHQGAVLTSTLEELRDTWDALGTHDPLWAVSMRPPPGQDAWDLETFFQSGHIELAADLAHVESLGVEVTRGRALDFGCGIGRITGPLADWFGAVVGVDVSPRLLRQARHHNGGDPRITYIEQVTEDLSAFPDASFDFIYCCNVLQTMPADLGLRYLREFLRLANDHAAIVFQVPVEFRDRPFHLPPEAFRADVAVMAPPVTLHAGQRAKLAVTVRNDSPVRWPASGSDGRREDLRVGNHWLDAAGAVVIQDDGRAHVPKPLRSGESVTVPLTITAPGIPGAYGLQVDAVIEHVAWFGARGSSVHTLPVRVEAGNPASAPHETDLPNAVMATHAIPRAEIEQTVAAAHGHILDAREDARAGPVWRSLRFVVTKRARGCA